MLSRILYFPFLGYRRARLNRLLADKTVLITGASYGIGECLAERLATTGAHLLLVARTEEKLLEVKQRVEELGGTADVFACDLRDPPSVETLLQEFCDLPNGIDVVVNNAGKSIRRSIFDSLDRFHDFQRTMDLNYFAPVQLLLALIPTLVERKGQVLNVSAVNVRLIPAPQWAAYQASKSAFDQWFRSVGPELNARGVRTSSIYLPLVRTRMIEPTAAYKSMPAMQPDEVASLLCRAIVGGRRTYAPWWTVTGEVSSTLYRWPCEVVMTRLMRPRRS